MTCSSTRWLLDRYGNETLSIGFPSGLGLPKYCIRSHGGPLLSAIKIGEMSGMRRLLICFAALAAATSPAWTAEPLSFKGKTITMIIGFPAGGGTDQSGRLIAAMLAKHLPGEPTLVTQNMPGAEGLMALNYFVQKTKPDGTSMTMGSQSEVRTDALPNRAIALRPHQIRLYRRRRPRRFSPGHQEGCRAAALRQEPAAGDHGHHQRRPASQHADGGLGP